MSITTSTGTDGFRGVARREVSNLDAITAVYYQLIHCVALVIYECSGLQ